MQGERGPMQATAPPAGNGGRPATAAVRLPLHLDKDTIVGLVTYERISPGITPRAGHGLTIPQERHSRTSSRRTSTTCATIFDRRRDVAEF